MRLQKVPLGSVTASVTSNESQEVKRVARLACMAAASNDASDGREM